LLLPTHWRIVESLNVVEDVGPRFGSGLIPSRVDTLPLEHHEETFDQCIVGATIDNTHAAGQVVPLQEALTFVAGKLAAPIRMQYQGRAFFTLPEGHKDSLEHQPAIVYRGHGPAHDLAET
jgi:hypothetical protein